MAALDAACAGRPRIAVLLQEDGRPGDALLYARAAQHDFERVGSGDADLIPQAKALVADLEQATK